MGLRRHERYAEFKKGTSNKFYQVEVTELEENGGASVVARWGRIGTDGQTKDYGSHWSFGSGQDSADALFTKKLRKGYKEVSPLEALASACEDPTERKNRGLSPVEVELPSWNSGSHSTDKRLNKVCSTALEKLNLIRASRWELTEKLYRQQMEAVFGQLRDTYKKVCETKSHKIYADDPHVASKFRVFFRLLLDEAGTFIYVEA